MAVAGALRVSAGLRGEFPLTRDRFSERLANGEREELVPGRPADCQRTDWAGGAVLIPPPPKIGGVVPTHWRDATRAPLRCPFPRTRPLRLALRRAARRSRCRRRRCVSGGVPHGAAQALELRGARRCAAGSTASPCGSRRTTAAAPTYGVNARPQNRWALDQRSGGQSARTRRSSPDPAGAAGHSG